MAKDPAFLFYAKDFYEGTRTMLPEERACYVDLLIYQHQNDFIPDDMKRVAMYCSGTDEATLKATLEAKFKLGPNGWYNEKLQIVKSERKDFAEKQSVNGKIGQFWKKAKALLSHEQYESLRKSLSGKTNAELYSEIKDKDLKNEDTLKATLQGMLKAMLKHLAIVNEDAIEDIIKEKEENKKEQKFSILNYEIDEILVESKAMQKQVSKEKILAAWKEFQSINSEEKFESATHAKRMFSIWIDKKKLKESKDETHNHGQRQSKPRNFN